MAASNNSFFNAKWPDDPDATEDLNSLFTHAWWDAETQEYRPNEEKPQ